MIIFIAILLSLILGVPIGLFIAGKKPKGKRSGYVRLSFGIILLSVGLWLVYQADRKFENYFDQPDLVSTRGEVIDSWMEGERAFHPIVVYRYHVADSIYSDTCHVYQPSFGGRKRRREVALKNLVEFTPGDTVTVYYHNSEPGKSTLNHLYHWSDYTKGGVGLLAMIAAVLLLSYSIRRTYI